MIRARTSCERKAPLASKPNTAEAVHDLARSIVFYAQLLVKNQFMTKMEKEVGWQFLKMKPLTRNQYAFSGNAPKLACSNVEFQKYTRGGSPPLQGKEKRGREEPRDPSAPPMTIPPYALVVHY